MNERAEAPNANQYGTLINPTFITVVPPCNPVGGAVGLTNVSYRIATIGVYNADTASITLNLLINSGSGSRLQLAKATLATLTSFTSATAFPHGILIRGPEYLEMTLDAGTTTTNPTYFSTWVELRS